MVAEGENGVSEFFKGRRNKNTSYADRKDP
jgi:hypothetical protein